MQKSSLFFLGKKCLKRSKREGDSVIETKYTKPNGDVSINLKTAVYQKGVDYIRKLLKKKGYVAQS